MSTHGKAPPSHVGPNAITQVIAALRHRHGEPVCAKVLAQASLVRYAAEAPSAMVHEDEVGALQRAVRAELPPGDAAAVLREAGLRTGDYLLAHRIPRFAQAGLRLLPAPLAARALIGAIGGHAWTFAGSGTFRAMPGHPLAVEIAGCPLVAGQSSHVPLCDMYVGVFQRLFEVLVSPRAQAVETACAAMGAPACRFEMSWGTQPVPVADSAARDALAG
ncbi:bacteriochlorophyll 4-vinyl reductase [Dichotomicrobium thermohalophilum]|uniref:Divinyl protochlorophyllide a 8-vinyl-reductase n=1 Tax=Dichotomicrobium thermohalophilum TaxID=933063 RepID=A0A397Q234_9HYPH|nr:bacteriochlorophyll 4-vinyl reductase [Dichotomicrobium thermohalophilum]RIA55118.1 divinyl protochlorophyllide a 8-vinyl-reductase [Dichotomicrobium thermohalophilum]